MMVKVGRNDPCPCGSGKKHKQCCLRKRQDEQREQQSRHGAVERALGWLRSHHGEAMEQALFGDFLGGLAEEDLERIGDLSDSLQQMLLVNAYEWLLAEGELEADGEVVSVGELVQGPGGPLLGAEERQWIEQMQERPLGLFEVQESLPGEGLWIRNALDPQAPRMWVEERSGSQSLRQGDVIGVRPLEWKGRWFLSGATYIFPPGRVIQVKEVIEEELANLTEEDAQIPELAAYVVGHFIRDVWLESVFQPQAMPELVDASTGEPLLLITDHYRVEDWDRLSTALTACDDVEGDREEGWVRFEEMAGGAHRSLLALNPGKGRRLEAFARTRRRADEGREWLARVAGEALTFRTREITDPTSGPALKAHASRPGKGTAEVPLTTELARQIYQQIYATWADDPIPALGGDTPRQAVASKKGRRKVADLLVSYERSEVERAREEGREPVDLGFLWESVGLERGNPAG